MLSLIGSLNSNSAMHFYVSISLSNKSMHPVNVNVNTNLFSALRSETWGTGIRGLMRGMTTLPQGNQELLVVRDKVGRPPLELGVSKSTECDILQCIIVTMEFGLKCTDPVISSPVHIYLLSLMGCVTALVNLLLSDV